jgi:hypothetical protein
MAPEPRNPFYVFLLIFSFLFVVTALAIAVVPVLEQKATQAGQPPPPSAFRDALRQDGWRWLILQAAGIAVCGLASMALDRWRRLQSDRAAATMPPEPGNDASKPAS